MTTWQVGVDLRGAELLTVVRLLLVADLLARVTEELQGEQVALAVLETAGRPERSQLRSLAKALRIRDPGQSVVAAREPTGRTRPPEEAFRVLGVPPAVCIAPARGGHAIAAAAGQPRWFHAGTPSSPSADISEPSSAGDVGTPSPPAADISEPPSAGHVGTPSPPAHVGAVSTEAQAGAVPRTFRVGAVSTPAHAGAAFADLRDHEPLAIRLALLRFPYENPAVLSTARLHRAEETLLRWRFRVAGWFDMPPAPAPSATMKAIHDALVTDLDAAAVLVALHRLEVDPTVPSGSKFEAFDQADRVLALDLRHCVHRLH